MEAPFNQAVDDLHTLVRSEAVHVSIMRKRIRIVKLFFKMAPLDLWDYAASESFG